MRRVLLVLAVAALALIVLRLRERRRFEGAVEATEARLAGRFEELSAVLRALAAKPPATAAEFNAAALADKGPPALGFARRFRRGETGRVESELHAQGFAGLRVWPDLGREERSAIVWLSPLQRDLIGFDMLTDPVRREALERARDTGAPALSGLATLADAGPGFLLCAPVYGGGPTPAALEQRRAEITGWIVRAVRAADLFKALLGAAPPDLAISDGDTLLRPHAAQREEKRALTLGGRTWTLAFGY